MGRIVAYILGGLSTASALLTGLLGLLLAWVFFSSHVDSDRLVGLFIAAGSLLHVALPVFGLLLVAWKRTWIGVTCCAVSLLVSVPLLLFVPVAIEAAARP